MSDELAHDLAPVIDEIIRAVAELPNRTSPEDNPDMMLVTVEELWDILTSRLDAASHATRPVGEEDVRELVKRADEMGPRLTVVQGNLVHDLARCIERLSRDLAARTESLRIRDAALDQVRGERDDARRDLAEAKRKLERAHLQDSVDDCYQGGNRP